jgi:hypothetical protein
MKGYVSLHHVADGQILANMGEFRISVRKGVQAYDPQSPSSQPVRQPTGRHRGGHALPSRDSHGPDL